jgi:hypothetical protein
MVWLLFKCPQMYNKVWLSSLYCSMRNLCENNKQGRTSVLLPLAILICLYTKITKFPGIGAMQNGGGRLEHIGTDDKNEKHTSQNPYRDHQLGDCHHTYPSTSVVAWWQNSSCMAGLISAKAASKNKYFESDSNFPTVHFVSGRWEIIRKVTPNLPLQWYGGYGSKMMDRWMMMGKSIWLEGL